MEPDLPAHSVQPQKDVYSGIRQEGIAAVSFHQPREDTLQLDARLTRDTSFLEYTWLNDQSIRVAALRERNFTFLVGYPVAELREALENLFSIFLVLIPIALVVSVVGGLYLANTSLRPVDEVTTRARRITAENLDQTIPPRDVDDEIGRLISTFNDMIQRLHSSFAQVRQFSADASHELRTPLTVMRGEIELALRNPKTPRNTVGFLRVQWKRSSDELYYREPPHTGKG